MPVSSVLPLAARQARSYGQLRLRGARIEVYSLQPLMLAMETVSAVPDIQADTLLAAPSIEAPFGNLLKRS